METLNLILQRLHANLQSLQTALSMLELSSCWWLAMLSREHSECLYVCNMLFWAAKQVAKPLLYEEGVL